jgi:uncharacterized protein with HEPN domain
MLKSIRNDLMHLLNILESIGKIRVYSQDCDSAEGLFELNEQLNYNAILNLLAHIGDTTTKLSDQIKESHIAIEWQKIKDLRNRITHDYVGVDVAVIFRVMQQDIPTLEKSLSFIIKELLEKDSFDTAEFELAKSSRFYKHIRFDLIASSN